MTHDITPPITDRLKVWHGDAPPSREILCDIGRGDASPVRAILRPLAQADHERDGAGPTT
jgi:hypothetical protein